MSLSRVEYGGGVIRYALELYNHALCQNDDALRFKMVEAEEIAKRLGFNLMSWDGNGFFTHIEFESEEEAIQFKLTHL